MKPAGDKEERPKPKPKPQDKKRPQNKLLRFIEEELEESK